MTDAHRPLEVVDVETWTRPLPGNDPLANEYFRLCAAGTLTIERCPECRSAQHYPRGICMRCGATPVFEAVSGLGTVYTFSIVRQNGVPPFKGMVPYVLALVDLDEGPRLMGNIVDCDPEEVEVGDRVRAFVLRANPEVGIPQWRLAR
jgi:uncharacterized OB-fold protein